MSKTINTGAALALLAFAAPLPAAAADLVAERDAVVAPAGDNIVTYSGGVGVVWLEANELVYTDAGSDTRLSQLIWQSTAPIASAAVELATPAGWTVSAKAQVALSGDSYMEDYDWISPYATGSGDEDWSDRSQHDDTALEWYFNGSLLLGYNLTDEGGLKLNVNGGFKYTDVKWTAYGGSYVYSDGGYRNEAGDFPDGERGITYRQMLPAVVVGLDGEYADGDWTFAGGAHAGLAFKGKDNDHHWQRKPPLDFIERFGTAPLLSVEGSVGYKIAEGMQLYLAGSAEQIFTMRGDTEVYDNNTGDLLEFDPDGAGADLFAATLSVGVKGTF